MFIRLEHIIVMWKCVMGLRYLEICVFSTKNYYKMNKNENFLPKTAFFILKVLQHFIGSYFVNNYIKCVAFHQLSTDVIGLLTYLAVHSLLLCDFFKRPPFSNGLRNLSHERTPQIFWVQKPLVLKMCDGTTIFRTLCIFN